MAIDPRIRARRVAVLRAEGRRRLRFLLVAVGLVGLAVGAWGLTRTPLLDLDHVRVEGVAAADAGEVRTTLDLEPGTAMFDLDLGGIERDLTALPWVRSATAEREWPGTVRVTVEPRTPVAVVGLVTGGASFLVDREGVLLRPAGTDSNLPRIAVAPTVAPGEVERSALPAIDVAVAIPDDLLSWVDAVTLVGKSIPADQHDLGLDLVGSAQVRLGGVEFIDDKLAAVRAVLEGTDLSCVELIDVAVADLPTMLRNDSCEAGAGIGAVSGGA
jgi:cell division protein FtsQ